MTTVKELITLLLAQPDQNAYVLVSESMINENPDGRLSIISDTDEGTIYISNYEK